MRQLILPGDPEFYATLGTTLPPSPPGSAYIVRAGSLLLEPATQEEIDEYLLGGEYDERLSEMEPEEDEELS